MQLPSYFAGAHVKYMKHMINVVNLVNYVSNYTLIEEELLGDKLESIVYE